MNRQGLIVGLVIIGIVMAILFGFNLTNTEIETVFEKDDITKISVFYQPDFTIFDITDPDEISEFLTIVSNCQVEKAEGKEEMVGYIYSLTLFVGDIDYGRIDLGNSLSIYPSKYVFVEGDIDQYTLIDYLDNRYKMSMNNR